MKTLGNILWHFPFFGFVTAIVVYLFGLLLTVTVVASPIGLGLMELGKFLFWPFGNEMVSKRDLNIEQNNGWKLYSGVIRIIYFPFGLFFCIASAIQVAFLFISIIGIPAALVIAKCLGTYFNPVNKKCVPSSVKNELDRRKAEDSVNKYFAKETPKSEPRPQTNIDENQQYSNSESLKASEPLFNPEDMDSLKKNVSERGKQAFVWANRNKQTLLSSIGGVIILYFAYSLFLKPNPEKDGRSISKAYCECNEERTNRIVTTYSSFVGSFESNNYRRRIDARNDLNRKITEASSVNGECEKAANEMLLSYQNKYSNNVELLNRFQTSSNQSGNNCHPDESKIGELYSQIDQKINSILEPEPDIEQIKSDLIGKSIPGWNFQYLSQLSEVAISNSFKSKNRNEYQIDIKFNTNGDQRALSAQILIAYILNDQGWQFSSIKENNIAFVNKAHVNNWTSVQPLINCRYNFNSTEKIWVKDGFAGNEFQMGPDVTNTINLTQNEIFIKSRESQPVDVVFTYFPN